VPHVIHQAARGRHHDVDAGSERPLLDVHRDAAIDRYARHGGVVGQALHLVLNLDRQLARGRRISVRVRGGCGGASWRNRCRIGTRNAAVLPVPVSAQAITSAPDKAIGITPLWMERVSAQPRSRMPLSSRSSSDS
jgi:hypothetical protein